MDIFVSFELPEVMSLCQRALFEDRDLIRKGDVACCFGIRPQIEERKLWKVSYQNV